MSESTLTIEDRDGLISASDELDIRECADYVIGLIDRFIDWQGTLDVMVRVRPASELTWSTADGLLPALAQIGWDGTDWRNDTLDECLTGIDRDPALPDAGCTIYLADDGTLRNYGAPVWFDPDPQFGVDPGVPDGWHDFVGILTHEIFHCLGIYGSTRQWKAQVIQSDDGTYYFAGTNTVELLGEPLILAPWSATYGSTPDHYGNTGSSQNNAPRGLMFQWGNYENNRWDIGLVDLAILSDLGIDVTQNEGLALFELQDDLPVLAGGDASDRLWGDYHANRMTGGSGNDNLDGGAGNDTAVFTGNASDYTIAFTDNGGITVTAETGTDGTDRLTGIERLQFADRGVAYDLDGHAGDVARILGAVFGAASVANVAYAGIGLELRDGGMSMADLGALAMSVTGNSSPTAVATLLWQNVVGFTPATADIQPYVQMLNNGMSIGRMVELAASHELNAANIDLVGLNATGLDFA